MKPLVKDVVEALIRPYRGVSIDNWRPGELYITFRYKSVLGQDIYSRRNLNTEELLDETLLNSVIKTVNGYPMPDTVDRNTKLLRVLNNVYTPYEFKYTRQSAYQWGTGGVLTPEIERELLDKGVTIQAESAEPYKHRVYEGEWKDVEKFDLDPIKGLQENEATEYFLDNQLEDKDSKLIFMQGL